MFFLFFLFYTVFLTASLIEDEWHYFDHSQLKKVKTGSFLLNQNLKKIITFHEFYLDFDYQDEKVDDKENISKYGYYVKKQIEQTAKFYEKIADNISKKSKKILQNYMLFLSKEIINDQSNCRFSIFALFPLCSIAKKDNEFKEKVANFVDRITHKNNKLHSILQKIPIKIQISDYMKKIEDSSIIEMIKNIDINDFYRNNPGENPQQKLIDLYKNVLKAFIPKKPLDNSLDKRNLILKKIKNIPFSVDIYENKHPKFFLQSLKKQLEKSYHAIENCLNNNGDFKVLGERIDSFMNATNKQEKKVSLLIQALEPDKVNLFTNNHQVVNAQYNLENMKLYSSIDKNIIYLKDENGTIYSVSKTEIERDGLLELINCINRDFSRTMQSKKPSAFWSRFFVYTLTFFYPALVFFMSYTIKRNPERENIKKIYELPIIGYASGIISMFFLYVFFQQIKLDFYSVMA